jgi:hypothetical protein
MKRLGYLVASVIATYLLGCFYSVSFDISAWSSDARCVTVLFMAVAAVGALIATDHRGLA